MNRPNPKIHLPCFSLATMRPLLTFLFINGGIGLRQHVEDTASRWPSATVAIFRGAQVDGPEGSQRVSVIIKLAFATRRLATSSGTNEPRQGRMVVIGRRQAHMDRVDTS